MVSRRLVSGYGSLTINYSQGAINKGLPMRVYK